MQKILFLHFFLLLLFWLGPARPMWLGWTQLGQPGHWSKPVTRLGNMKHEWTKSRVHEQVKEMN